VHEASVCRALLAQVLEILVREHATAVHSIRLRAGVLSGHDARHLVESFAHVAAGTAAAGARVDVEIVPLRVHCPGCGADGVVSADHLECPACGHPATQLIDGDGLQLVDVELTLPREAAHDAAP
jgi:hydrogenase nickel incorporation protein HypA/HybF